MTNIDNIYLINLDRRQDRLAGFVEQSKKSTIINNYQRVSAIDGSMLMIDCIQQNVTTKGYNDIINNTKTKGLYLTRGALGLALTYKQILTECQNNILFLEDDIIVDDQFDNVLLNSLNELPSDWDILYLGWYYSKNLKINYYSTYINEINGQINGTQGWIVNPHSAKKILEIFPITYQIDTEIYRHKNLKKYCTTKPIILRNSIYRTDIQN